MRATALLYSDALHDDESGLYDLRVQAVRLTIYATAAAAFVFNLAVAFTPFVPRQGWLLVGTLILTTLLSHRALEFGAKLAVTTLSVGLVLTIVLASILFPSLPLACAYSLVVILAGVLISPRASLFTAFWLSALVAFLVGGPLSLADSTTATVALILIWANVLACWLAARPLETALEWSWQSYARAMRVAEESRTRQGELGRLAKSLNETCERLEDLSRELERARRAATEARHLKDEFAATVSHEMRTPLNLIIGFAEMMVVDPTAHHHQPLPRGYQADAEAIFRNACHLSNLIDDVLDLSQIEAHRMSLDKQPVALARVVDEAITSVSSLFERRGLSLRADLPDDLPLLNIDRTRVRQILINLLGNAARFTGHGGITISASSRGNECVVSVTDTGTGIPPEVLSRVFEEFRQFGQSGASRTGSGLGLSISKRLAELHGGSMWVESRVGEGSVFSFTLPLSGEVAAVPIRDVWETWARVEPRGSPPTLVVVDPSGECARLLHRYLEGYRLLAVTDLAEARRAIAAAVAVAAVVVVRVGDGPSAPVASDSAAPPDASAELALGAIPVITCTVRGVQPLAQTLGVNAYLVKPVTQQQIETTVRHLGIQPRTLLVADDDPEMVRLLSLFVRGFPGVERVFTAPNGVSALALLREKRPDLVLLDLAMPELDGPGVVRAMRESDELRDIPVIIISARGFTEDRVAVSTLSLTRESDLSAAEFIRCLRVSLDALLMPDGADSAPAPIGALPD